jgi:hypothetical protein
LNETGAAPWSSHSLRETSGDSPEPEHRFLGAKSPGSTVTTVLGMDVRTNARKNGIVYATMRSYSGREPFQHSHVLRASPKAVQRTSPIKIVVSRAEIPERQASCSAQTHQLVVAIKVGDQLGLA